MAPPRRSRGAALVRCLIYTWEHDPAGANFFRTSLLMAAHEQIARGGTFQETWQLSLVTSFQLPPFEVAEALRGKMLFTPAALSWAA